MKIHEFVSNIQRNIENYSRNTANILTSSPALTGAAVYTLASNHDNIIHVAVGSLLVAGAVARAGYKIEKITYTNMFTFFPTAAVRLFKKAMGSKGSTDQAGSSKLANKVLLAVYRFEMGLMRITSLPFGVSVLCVAKK